MNHDIQVIDVGLWLIGAAITIIVALMGMGYKSVGGMFGVLEKQVESLKQDISRRLDNLETQLDKQNDMLIEHAKIITRVEARLNGQEDKLSALRETIHPSDHVSNR